MVAYTFRALATIATFVTLARSIAVRSVDSPADPALSPVSGSPGAYVHFILCLALHV